jgi:hypothetical protein
VSNTRNARREEVREQQPAVVDEAAPRLADAPRRREAAEDGREHVAGQSRCRRGGLHGDQAQAQGNSMVF